MRVGDIDGYDVIYDKKGNLILKKNEKIEYLNEKCTGLSIRTSWLNFGSQGVYKGMEGKGRLYITNRRIVQIRRPDPAGVALYNYNPDSADGTVKTIFAQELRKMGAFEYCEIKYSDIEFFDFPSFAIDTNQYFILIKKNNRLKRYFFFFIDNGAEKIVSKRIKEMGIPRITREMQVKDFLYDISWPIRIPIKKIKRMNKEQ